MSVAVDRLTVAPTAKSTQALAGHVMPLGRLIVDFRLAAVILTLVATVATGDRPALAAALAAAALGSFLLLKYWASATPALSRHPALLGIDVALSVALLALAGALSPFFAYTLGTAALAGALLRRAGAAVLAAILMLGYYGTVLAQSGPLPRGDVAFQVFIGLPVLYPLAALGAHAVRALLLDQAAKATVAHTAASAAVAADERARLAREMHDSLAKTLHGISLSAQGLTNWISRSPEVAVQRAAELSNAAQIASAEARALIGNLRADSGDAELGVVVRGILTDWAVEARIQVTAAVDDVPLDATARYELLCVLREALRNISAHAAARHVDVALRNDDSEAELVVRDDGKGFVMGNGIAAWQRRGHYGLVGMTERAERAGGSLRMTSMPGNGTTVHMRVPSGEVTPNVGSRA